MRLSWTVFTVNRWGWADGKRQRVEECLGDVFESLLVVSDIEKAQRLKAEAWRREWAERERRAAAEAEVRRREQQRIDDLDAKLAAWRRAEDLRAFLAAIEREIANSDRQSPSPRLTQWIDWLRGHIGATDPIGRLLRDDDR